MEKFTIGLPCSPSHVSSKKDFICYKILISYGGGMGGANNTYYCLKKDLPVLEDEKRFIKFKNLINSEEVTINKRFIVSVSEVKIVKVDYDITKWINYNEKKCNSCIETIFYSIGVDVKYEIKNEFKTNDHCIVSKSKVQI